MDRGVRRAGAAAGQTGASATERSASHRRGHVTVDLLSASMPGGLPIVSGRSPGVVLVPGVGASFLGVGVLDFRLGVDDLSF